MPLLRRQVTPRMIAANRRNARKCTGPRTARGKAQCRLNSLRHGLRSRLAEEYFRLWWFCYLAGPWEAPPPYDPTAMPLPWTGRPRSAKSLREYLCQVAPYLPLGHRRPSGNLNAAVTVDSSSPRLNRSGGAEAGKLRNPFFDVQNHQVLDSKGGLIAKGRKRAQNEPTLGPPQLGSNRRESPKTFRPSHAENLRRLSHA